MRIALGIAVVAAVAGVSVAGPASAKDDRREVEMRGDCSQRTDWKLEAKERDGGLEVEFEVDSNRSGQRWHYSVAADGSTFATGRTRTRAPSGSFAVERRISGSPSTRSITARAQRNATGEVCLATLRI